MCCRWFAQGAVEWLGARPEALDVCVPVWFLLRALWAHVVWPTGKVCVVGVSGSAALGLVELGRLSPSRMVFDPVFLINWFCSFLLSEQPELLVVAKKILE